MAGLSTNRLVRTTVDLATSAAQGQTLSVLLLLVDDAEIDVVERVREYAGIDEVSADFGTSGAAYSAASLWFQQRPQPTSILIGRWAQTASKGLLRGATLSSSAQAIANWTAITAGSFKITIDAGSATDITGLNFSAQTNLNGVASVITAGLTGATCTWNAAYGRFQIESATTGTTSKISFLSAAASGTDISNMLGMRSTSSGAYVADGIAAETATDAVAMFDDHYPGQWYFLMMPTADNDDHLAVAAYVEAATIKHVYGITTEEAGALVAANTTNIAYLLKQLGYKRPFTQYSSSSSYAAISALARIATVNYAAANSAITVMYKTEPGVTAEVLTSAQASALKSFNCNVYASYNNGTSIIQYGTMASGNYLDEITGTDAIAVDIQAAVFNAFYTSSTKIPQTDAGNQLIVGVIESRLSQFVNNGVLAPGVWNNSGFGVLSQGDFLAKGFYVYAPPISSQTQADREARKGVPIQIACKLAGATQEADILITVNR